MHVFTYGTLMFPEVWKAVVGRKFETIPGTAAGYAIYRVRGTVYPAMTTASVTSIVPGLLYLDVDAESIVRLDRFEGPHYERLEIKIDCADGVSRQAATYVVPNERGHLLTTEPWTPESFLASGGLAQFIASYEGFSLVEEEGEG
jgi:gamma-glutamylcyclotransferase (GGCT)/AIG2-like uncharacterized protein YtfP